MINAKSFLCSNFGITFAVIFTSIMLVIFAVVVLCLWWVDMKKRPLKELGNIIKMWFVNIFDKIADFFSANSTVKTVYSDKSLNYSGTEFLPIPTKAPTNQYTYEFVGWDKNGVDEKGNIVIRAIYLQKVIKCHINVFDDDKQTLFRSETVEYGAGINLSDLKPRKPESKEFTYEFVGWDKDTSAFYGNENVYAVYNAIPKKYVYTFFEEDGETIISQGTALYGTPIYAPADPKKTSSNPNEVYEFAGWKNYEDGMILTKDMEFVAVFKLKQVGGIGTSSIIKTDGNKVTVVSEDKLPENENSNATEIKKTRLLDAIKFDMQKDEKPADVKEIKVGTTGVIRKKQGMTIERNTEKQKFTEINSAVEEHKPDEEVHQKIQLMSIKKTTGKKENENNIQVIKPREEEEPKDDELLGNMMINKIKIDKKDDK